jgi:hypothetical protein
MLAFSGEDYNFLDFKKFYEDCVLISNGETEAS